MGRSSNYEIGMYEELEKLNKKLDKLLKEKGELSLTIYTLKLEIEKLNKTIKEKDELNKKLQEEIDRLKNKNDKDSTNSSKPSSTNYTTPKKKTGANLYNYRIKTGNKVGGQLGHTGYNLSKEKVEKLIEDKKVEVKEITHYIGGNKKEEIIKYRVGIEIKPYIEKYVFKFHYLKNSIQM